MCVQFVVIARQENIMGPPAVTVAKAFSAEALERITRTRVGECHIYFFYNIQQYYSNLHAPLSGTCKQET